MLNVKALVLKILTYIFSLHQDHIARTTVKEISSKITLGGAWSGYIKKAYILGDMVYISLEVYASTVTSGYEYTVGNIASGYRPGILHIFTGHTTTSNYTPNGVVTAKITTGGDIKVTISNSNGNYLFINMAYPKG